MGYGCANDIFNYCSGKPEWGKPPKELGIDRYPGGGHCRLDPMTCGKHQTLCEQVGNTGVKPTKGERKTKKAKKGK